MWSNILSLPLTFWGCPCETGFCFIGWTWWQHIYREPEVVWMPKSDLYCILGWRVYSFSLCIFFSFLFSPILGAWNSLSWWTLGNIRCSVKNFLPTACQPQQVLILKWQSDVFICSYDRAESSMFENQLSLANNTLGKDLQEMGWEKQLLDTLWRQLLSQKSTFFWPHRW